MKRPVVWSNAARDDFLGIIRFIARDNPEAAERVADTIDRVVAYLGEIATGRPGRVTDTYEKVVPDLPYLVAYEVTDHPGGGQIAILHVIHGARDWPDERWPGWRLSSFCVSGRRWHGAALTDEPFNHSRLHQSRYKGKIDAELPSRPSSGLAAQGHFVPFTREKESTPR